MTKQVIEDGTTLLSSLEKRNSEKSIMNFVCCE